MEKQKKLWVKPEIHFIPADSPKYKQIMAAMAAETKGQDTAPTPQRRGD